jgi:hypothetical protein
MQQIVFLLHNGRLEETEFYGVHPYFVGGAVFYIIMEKSEEG